MDSRRRHILTIQRARQGQGIMTSDFLHSFRRETEAVEVFEYGKNNNRYWDGAKLHKQVVSKALPIAEALYPQYSLLFLFDNATNHSVYAKLGNQARAKVRGTDIPQPPRNILKYYNTEKFRYDDYLAISVFKLLLSVVVVDIWLSESGEIFG